MKMPRVYIKNHVLIKYEKESSKLRMSGGSWTINVEKFPLAKYHTIRYITRQYVYDIDTEDALANGFFKNLGGEKKLVVPIKHWRRIEYALSLYKKHIA
tara:strand:+ start:223 stop:519 length:297 start_codon:yes stop_codon:yes gene_type:complete